MPDARNSESVPEVCPTCARSQVHHALDPGGDSFYCPHREVWAIRGSDGEWTVLRGIDQAAYRAMVKHSEDTARLLATHGLVYSRERGVHRPDADHGD